MSCMFDLKGIVILTGYIAFEQDDTLSSLKTNTSFRNTVWSFCHYILDYTTLNNVEVHFKKFLIETMLPVYVF